MKSAETHPTPPRVVDAIQVIAAWLREIDAAEAVIAPTGGATFHPTRKADELLEGWAAAERLAETRRLEADDAAKLIAQERAISARAVADAAVLRQERDALLEGWKKDRDSLWKLLAEARGHNGAGLVPGEHAIHPWYGPCDGFADGGACSECERVLFGARRWARAWKRMAKRHNIIVWLAVPFEEE